MQNRPSFPTGAEALFRVKSKGFVASDDFDFDEFRTANLQSTDWDEGFIGKRNLEGTGAFAKMAVAVMVPDSSPYMR